jgi:hypothetical protein
MLLLYIRNSSCQGSAAAKWESLIPVTLLIGLMLIAMEENLLEKFRKILLAL